MRKFKPGDYVTPKEGTDPERRRIYYWRYYYRGDFGELYRGRILQMYPHMVGIVRSIAPSVVGHPHEEFLVIDFCEPITGSVQRVGLHHSEVKEAPAPEYEIPVVSQKIPESAFPNAR